MKYKFFMLLLVMGQVLALAQETIRLPKGDIGSITWPAAEKQYYSNIWQTEVVTNVSQPSLQVFRPTTKKNTGMAVIIAPGGGLYALSIESEGKWVAEWLNNKGITAFVLRYRLVPTGDDGVADITKLSMENPQKIFDEVSKVMPLSIQDGLNAIEHVRQNSKAYGLDSKKIGFMGFSAGGAVTMGVGYEYTEENRPDFLVPIYAWTDAMPVQKPRSDAPPMQIICATDDPLGLAKGSIELYSSMLKAQKTVALHMYSKGGHGFGMREQGLPSDHWIERFYEWSIAQGFIVVE